MTTIDSPFPFTTLSEFVNEPTVDFIDAEVAARMQAALKAVRGQFGQRFPGKFGDGKATDFTSVNPAQPDEIIATHSFFENSADKAIQSAEKAFLTWKKEPLATRCSLLRRTAAALRTRRFEFNAWLTLEAGKNWAEADADTAEAIDFLEFYALLAEDLDHSQPAIQFPDELDLLRYIPLGVGVILPPWNFALAILAGMTCAAIVCGNTVVLKPSPLTPTIGQKFYELLVECGLPEGVVNLVQGDADLGRQLVEDTRVRFISFTGSKRAGLLIHQTAAITRPGQRWIKRTVLEMGGKDAILIDSSADLDLAAQGVVASAFGFSGQKCSACSRLIVHTDVYEPLLERVVQRTRQLRWGATEENTDIGPVIDVNSYNRVLSYLAAAPTQGRILAGGSALTPPEKGFFIAPTIVADVDPNASIAQEEIFGPVLAAMRVSSFKEGLTVVNNTEFGLTGAVYSFDENHLQFAAEEFHTGNLYLNRKCTGAMVGAHPFGGFNMSGTDSKAGGKDYLLHFTQAKSIARRLL